MKMILALCTLLFLSCHKEEAPKVAQVQQSAVVQAEDDFSDLKKKDDESCDTEEDLEKKIMEQAKKKPAKAFKLQGGDTGCTTN